MSVTNEIANNANYTAQYQASQETATGAAQKMTSTDFLNLMMKQLQYQDPLEPVDNSQFLAQQAQFSQLEATNEMNETLANSAGFSQASSLIGKFVTITDPDNDKNTITGLVQAASYDGADSSIVIDGKEYSMDKVLYVHNTASVVTNADGSSTSGSESSSSSSSSGTDSSSNT